GSLSLSVSRYQSVSPSQASRFSLSLSLSLCVSKLHTHIYTTSISRSKIHNLQIPNVSASFADLKIDTFFPIDSLSNNDYRNLSSSDLTGEIAPALFGLKSLKDLSYKTSNKSFLETNANGGDEAGTEEEQEAFMKELKTFHKERCLEFKPPRFYGEPLNCLKLWRAVIRLGGYEQVTSKNDQAQG
ncbi:hypothetical protein HYC85_031598, partial [Camellia sinensis]